MYVYVYTYAYREDREGKTGDLGFCDGSRPCLVFVAAVCLNPWSGAGKLKGLREP